jgi:hypothetical protein
MKIPKEMLDFSLSFHSHVFSKGKSLNDIIDDCVSRVLPENLANVLNYLKSVVSETRDPGTLMKIWLAGGSNIGCNREGYPAFFDLLIERLQFVANRAETPQ